MTIRRDATRLFSNRIIGDVRRYPVEGSNGIEEFVNRQEMPRGSDSVSHKAAWVKMFDAFAREYPEEQSKHDNQWRR